MTEAGPVLSMCLAFAKEPFKVKSGACGTVVRNAELKIIDPDTGKSLGRNLPGEICIRGQQIMKGTEDPLNILACSTVDFSVMFCPCNRECTTLPLAQISRSNLTWKTYDNHQWITSYTKNYTTSH